MRRQMESEWIGPSDSEPDEQTRDEGVADDSHGCANNIRITAASGLDRLVPCYLKQAMTRPFEAWIGTAACAFIVVTPAICGAQEGPASPITAATRTEWVAKSVVGPKSLVAGVFVAGFGTAIDLPPEWRRSADGFALRYAARDAAILTSNGLEAALGSMWGEDPRYFKCQCSGVSHRIGNAVKLAVFAQRSDGRIGPAW